MAQGRTEGSENEFSRGAKIEVRKSCKNKERETPSCSLRSKRRLEHPGLPESWAPTRESWATADRFQVLKEGGHTWA